MGKFQKYFLSLALLLSGFQAAWAVDKISEPEVKISKIKSVEDEIYSIHISGEFESTHNKIHSTPDLATVLEQRYKEFVDGTGRFAMWKGIPNSRKVLSLNRYQLGDKRLEAMIRYAQDQGIGKIIINADGNMFYEGKFEAGQKFNSNFKEAKPLESVGGEILQRLITEGGENKFSINDPQARFQINLAPLQNRELVKIADIYHHKHDVFGILNEARTELEDARLLESSHNAVTDKQGNPNPRINILIEHEDPELAKYVYFRALAMAENFQKNGVIGDVKKAPPLKLKFIDDSKPKEDPYRETELTIAFTDGQENPNYWIAEPLFRAAGKNPDGEEPSVELKAQWATLPKIEIEKVYLLQFAPTYRRAFSGIKAAMLANQEMTVDFFADGQFLFPLGFGVVSTMFGFPLVPPFGPMVFPYPSALRDRITGTAWQMANPFAPDTDPNGAPTGKTVMHLKTTFMKVRLNNVPFTLLFNGSLNLSNHEENAELLVRYLFPGNSEMVASLVKALKDIQSQSKVDIPTGVFREIIENLIGNSVLEVEVPWVQRLIGLAREGKYSEVRSEIEALAAKKSQSEKLVKPEILKARLDLISKFIGWYKATPYFRQVDSPVRLGMIVMMALKAEEEKSAYSVKKILDFLVWSKGVTDDEMEKRIAEAWKVIEMKEPMPAKKMTALETKVFEKRNLAAPPPTEIQNEVVRKALDRKSWVQEIPGACEMALKAL